jgi:hypothetical protein
MHKKLDLYNKKVDKNANKLMKKAKSPVEFGRPE